jgi:hypothetical protein
VKKQPVLLLCSKRRTSIARLWQPLKANRRGAEVSPEAPTHCEKMADEAQKGNFQCITKLIARRELSEPFGLRCYAA